MIRLQIWAVAYKREQDESVKTDNVTDIHLLSVKNQIVCFNAFMPTLPSTPWKIQRFIEDSNPRLLIFREWKQMTSLSWEESV